MKRCVMILRYKDGSAFMRLRDLSISFVLEL